MDIIVGGYVFKVEEDEIRDDEVFFINKAKEELRETPEIKQESIETLQKLLKADDSGLNFPNDDMKLLVKFLRPCKFYPESAFQLIKRTYKFRFDHPKIFENLIPSVMKHAFDEDILTLLQLRQPESGSRVLLAEVGGKWNPKIVSLNDLWRITALFLEFALWDPRNQITGSVLVIDTSGFTMKHVAQIGPSFALALLNWIQDCIPLRAKQIHIINEPYVVDIAFAIFKPFVREKLRKRIYFHGKDRESLFKHIPANTFPKRYGGTLEYPELPTSVWYDHMLSREQEFKYYNSLGYSK